MEIPKQKRTYSRLQKSFWLIAGSEISALEKCPNEYNRHANIGLMILITSFFATMTAAVAGSRFVDNNKLGVFVFAVTWGLVIFSLDRSMVSSIKKSPGEDRKINWGYFWPRFVLAFILSFFMSIPLDHIVFKERIEYQMDQNKNNDWEERQKSLTEGYGIPGDSLTYKKAEKESDKLNTIIEAGCSACPIEDYKTNMKEGNNIKYSVLPSLEKKVNDGVKKHDNYLYILRKQQTPEGEPTISGYQVRGDRQLLQYRTAMNNAKRERNEKRNEMNKHFAEANNICQAWLNEKQAAKINADSIKGVVGTRIDTNTVKITNQAGGYKDMLDNMKGFDTQFVTLFLMPNWGVQVLKWLIFLVLLIIEILPTYLKLKTPFGQYDWLMHERDKVTEIEVKEKINQAEIAAAEVEQYRRKKEVELNKDLIDKVAQIEEQLANEMIQNWELKAKSNLREDIERA